MGEIIFKTELIKGAKGDRGEAGQADSIPTDGVIAFQGETVPDGYEETDPGDVFDEVYEDINAVKDMIADEYDTTATYNAGDFCIHENTLYKCTATTTGLWDSSKWVLTSAGDEIKANTSAIEAIVNEYSAKNILKYPYTDSTNTQGGITFTDNGDGTVNVSGSETTGSNVYFALENNISVTLGTKVSDIFPTAGKYTISCENADGTNIFMAVYIADVGSYDHISANGTDIEITNAMMSKTLRIHLEVKHDYALSSAITLKPMIRDARITDPTYAPYSMTNYQLTERVKIQQISVTTQIDGTCQLWHKSVMAMPIGFSVDTFPPHANEVNGSFTLSTNGYWYMMMKTSDGAIIAEKSAVVKIAYLSY